MKKLLLITFILLAIAGFTKAQVVTDFELIKLNLMINDPATDSSNMTVVPNPDPTGINTSSWVVRFFRDKDGFAFDGFWSALPVPVDVTVNKYVHVKVWKPSISPLHFKLQGGSSGDMETPSMSPQTQTGVWEDIVFDFSSKTGTWPTIVFMPDFVETVPGDMVLYFDDIMVNNDPAPNSAAVDVIEDFEIIPLNLLLGGTDDLSTMTLVPNPDPTGANTSNWVVKYLRDKDGLVYGGFWSPTAVDVTTNKYMHVKVWKPRLSPLHFKIQGGTTGDLETPSMTPQNNTNMWEDMVFDFSSKTGVYPTILLMPDFSDPVNLTNDIIIYFDDIILNNDPNPFVGFENIVKDSRVSVYPTPFNNSLVVKTDVDLKSIIITSALGQQVLSMQNLGTGTITINTSAFATGLYFITCYPESGNPYSMKIVKY